jgi:hypothetical protein
MTQTAQTTTIHLLAEVENTSVAFWFVKEGERVRERDPLVTLRHPSGASFTVLVPKGSVLDGAILLQRLLSVGSPVSRNAVLMILTSTTIEAGRAIVPLGQPGPEASRQDDERGAVDLVFVSSSLPRDLLFSLAPWCRRLYFRNYRLLGWLELVAWSLMLIAGTLLISHLAPLIPVLVGALLALALICLRQALMRWQYQKPGRRQADRARRRNGANKR